jgi:hypothetical protein
LDEKVDRILTESFDYGWMLNSLRQRSSRSISQQHINCKESLHVQRIRFSHQTRRTRNARVHRSLRREAYPAHLEPRARRYLVGDQELTKSGKLVDYDVRTELGLPDQEEFPSWMGKLSAPGIAEQVADDEGRFLDRSRTKAYSSRNMQPQFAKNVRKYSG